MKRIKKREIKFMSNTEKAYAVRLANEKHLVDIREAALLLSVNEATIRRYIEKGLIKEGVLAIRVGHNFRILRKELLELVIDEKLIGKGTKKKREMLDAAIDNSNPF